MILAVDIGSTNLKAALFDKDGVRLSDASKPLPYAVHTSQIAELSAAAVAECFFLVIKTAVSAALRRSEEIQTVAITSQAQTFCICDGSENPVSPFFGWADCRAHEEASSLQEILGPRFHERSGWPQVRPTHMISKALWWRKRYGLPEDHRIVSLPSFLAMRLGTDHSSDNNLAAMSGFYSIPTASWCAEALDATGATPAQLGGLVEPGRAIPTRCDYRPPGFSDSLKIVFAGNDHTAGAVGCGCSAGHPTLTLGTAGVLYRYAGEHPGPFSPAGLWGPYPGGGYYELLNIDHACSALDWADEFLFGTVDSPRFVEQAKSAQIRATSPLFFPDKWGNAEAWSGDGCRAEKAYAVLEGIAFAMRLLASPRFRGSTERIAVLGGGCRLDYWMQLVANVLGCMLVRASCDGLDGAVVVSRKAQFSPLNSNEVFSPDLSSPDLLELRFEHWRKLSPHPYLPVSL